MCALFADIKTRIPWLFNRKVNNKEPFRTGQQLDNNRVFVEERYFQDKSESFGSLVIIKLNRSDDGLYECIAENSAGKGYKNGHITVEFPPTFERMKTLPPAWIWDNHPSNLTCIPEAIPNATIIWKFNGLEIQSDFPFFPKLGNGLVSNLIVKRLPDRRVNTSYECVASNKHGTRSIWLPLKEAKIPEHVTQVKAHTITATTVKFTIEPPPFYDGLPIKSFTVRYKPARENSWDYAFNHTWSYRAPYILKNLVPEVTYHFRFAARNDVGLGPFMNGPSITMPRRSAPAEPKIVVPIHSILDGNSTQRPVVIAVSPYADHFELSWSVPNDNGDPIDSYIIRYCVTQKVNGAWRESECSEDIRQSVQYTNYELNTLRPDTVYKIELRALNTIGSSSPAQIWVKTAKGELKEYSSQDTYGGGEAIAKPATSVLYLLISIPVLAAKFLAM